MSIFPLNFPLSGVNVTVSHYTCLTHRWTVSCCVNDTGEKLYASKPIENIEKKNLKLA
jgi:hypothetical protein